MSNEHESELQEDRAEILKELARFSDRLAESEGPAASAAWKLVLVARTAIEQITCADIARIAREHEIASQSKPS